MRVTHQQRASLLALARHAAENEPHEGKRKAEAVWPIFRIHHQRSRYIYELYFRRKTISRELYDYCLREGIADANLIAKWKKVRAACCVLVRSLARQLTWRVLATPAGIREALLPSMHPNQGPLVRHRVRVPRTQGQARGGQGGRVPTLRLPRLRQRRLTPTNLASSLPPSLYSLARNQLIHPLVRRSSTPRSYINAAPQRLPPPRARERASIDRSVVCCTPLSDSALEYCSAAAGRRSAVIHRQPSPSSTAIISRSPSPPSSSSASTRPPVPRLGASSTSSKASLSLRTASCSSGVSRQ